MCIGKQDLFRVLSSGRGPIRGPSSTAVGRQNTYFLHFCPSSSTPALPGRGGGSVGKGRPSQFLGNVVLLP